MMAIPIVAPQNMELRDWFATLAYLHLMQLTLLVQPGLPNQGAVDAVYRVADALMDARRKDSTR